MGPENKMKNSRIKIIQRGRLQPDASLPNLSQAIVVAAPRHVVLRDTSVNAQAEILTAFVRDLKENGKSRSDLATYHPYEFVRYWRDHCESEKSAIFFHCYPEFILRIIRSENKPDEGKELFGVLAMKPSERIDGNCEDNPQVIEVDNGRRTVIIARSEKAAQSLLAKANARVRRLLDLKKKLGADLEESSFSLDFEDSSIVSNISLKEVETWVPSNDSCKDCSTTSKTNSNSYMSSLLSDLQATFFHSNSPKEDDEQQACDNEDLNESENSETKTETFGFTWQVPSWLNDLPWLSLEKTEEQGASKKGGTESFESSSNKDDSVSATRVCHAKEKDAIVSNVQEVVNEHKESREMSSQLARNNHVDCSQNGKDCPQERDNIDVDCHDTVSGHGDLVDKTLACAMAPYQEDSNEDKRKGFVDEVVYPKALVIQEPTVGKKNNKIITFDTKNMFYDINTGKFVSKSTPKQM